MDQLKFPVDLQEPLHVMCIAINQTGNDQSMNDHEQSFLVQEKVQLANLCKALPRHSCHLFLKQEPQVEKEFQMCINQSGEVPFHLESEMKYPLGQGGEAKPITLCFTKV